MSKELKPCPLCAGAVQLENILPHTHLLAKFMPDHPGSYVIECHACGLGLIRETREAVIDDWNRRASPPEPKTGDGWFPGETAPRDGSEFDAWTATERVPNVSWDPDFSRGWDKTGAWLFRISTVDCTHWELLEGDVVFWRRVPAPPTEEPKTDQEHADAVQRAAIALNATICAAEKVGLDIEFDAAFPKGPCNCGTASTAARDGSDAPLHLAPYAVSTEFNPIAASNVPNTFSGYEPAWATSEELPAVDDPRVVIVTDMLQNIYGIRWAKARAQRIVKALSEVKPSEPVWEPFGTGERLRGTNWMVRGDRGQFGVWCGQWFCAWSPSLENAKYFAEGSAGAMSREPEMPT